MVKAIHVPLIRALLVQHLYRLIQSTSAWRLERRSHHCGLSFIETISEVVKTLIMIHSSLLTLSCNITCNSNIPLSLECWQYELLIHKWAHLSSTLSEIDAISLLHLYEILGSSLQRRWPNRLYIIYPWYQRLIYSILIYLSFHSCDLSIHQALLLLVPHLLIKIIFVDLLAVLSFIFVPQELVSVFSFLMQPHFRLLQLLFMPLVI